uniref:DUF148 domain-containing protein n=1 Tax=Rhabditophanes sp. KR3021 TaxID=114890 RepID=A0AC35TN21_9BILA
MSPVFSRQSKYLWQGWLILFFLATLFALGIQLAINGNGLELLCPRTTDTVPKSSGYTQEMINKLIENGELARKFKDDVNRMSAEQKSKITPNAERIFSIMPKLFNKIEPLKDFETRIPNNRDPNASMKMIGNKKKRVNPEETKCWKLGK